MHLLGLQRALPWSRYRSLTDCMPMMRAVKDDNQLMRLAAAGATADSTYGEIDSFVFCSRGPGSWARPWSTSRSLTTRWP
jgi:hypothetical protein